MTVEEISKLAFKREYDPSMDMAETVLFYRLRDLYDLVKSRTISESEGKAQKTGYITEYKQNKLTLDNGRQSAERMAKLFRTAELAISAYRITRCLENADAIVTAIDGIPVKKGNDNE